MFIMMFWLSVQLNKIVVYEFPDFEQNKHESFFVAPHKKKHSDHGLRVDSCSYTSNTFYDNGFRKYITEANKGNNFTL
jgi:hypothetical protein